MKIRIPLFSFYFIFFNFYIDTQKTEKLKQEKEIKVDEVERASCQNNGGGSVPLTIGIEGTREGWECRQKLI